MKKILATLLALSMMLPLVAFGTSETVLTDCIYTATAQGMYEMTVTVTIENDVITDIVLDQTETAGVADLALETIPADILSTQGLGVDTVSGATRTSDGILNGVQDCLVQAGATEDYIAELQTITSDKANVSEVSDMTTQVLVVGGGLSGMSAAVSACDAGAEVIVIEKLSTLGGSSVLAGGGLIAAGTDFQVDVQPMTPVGSDLVFEEGEVLTPEHLFVLWEDAHEMSRDQSGAYDPELVMDLLNHSADTIHWIADHGFEFTRVSYGMYHSSAELGPWGYIDLFEERCIEAGASIYTNTAATSLIEEDGVVVGVIAEQNGQEFTIHADAVILATGGWSQSEELTVRFAPAYVPYVENAAASIGHTGDGILMGEAIGAAVYEYCNVLGLGLSPLIPGVTHFHYDFVDGTFMMINQDGNRFVDESIQFVALADASVYEDGYSYLVFDSNEVFADFIAIAEGNLDHENVFKADTIEELAAQIDVDTDNLVATASAYGVGEDAFGKWAEKTSELINSPYYALKCYPLAMGSLGGLIVNESQEILDVDGNAIPGLYGAGELINGDYYTHVYIGASALLVAAQTGIYAGDYAANYVLGN